MRKNYMRRLILCILSVLILASCTQKSAVSLDSEAIQEGVQLLNQNRYDEAIEVFLKETDEHPQMYQAYEYAGDAYALKKDYVNAGMQYSLSIMNGGRKRICWLKRALIGYLDGQSEQGQTDLDQAIALPEDVSDQEIFKEFLVFMTRVKPEKSVAPIMQYLNSKMPVPEETPKPVDDVSLADITNLSELIAILEEFTSPAYSEETGFGEYTDREFYQYMSGAFASGRFSSVDDMYSYLRQYFTVEGMKSYFRPGFRFAYYNEKLYWTFIPIGWGRYAADEAALVKYGGSGVYYVRVPGYASDNETVVDSPVYAICKEDGVFKITGNSDGGPEPAIGYAIINTSGLEPMHEPSISSDRAPKLNAGAIIDVYEIKPAGVVTWYRTVNWETAETCWVPDYGNDLSYTPYE